MEEYVSEELNSLYDSYSISEYSNTNTIFSKDDLELKENIEETNECPVKCPDCWEIPRILAKFKTKNFCLICDKNHKNMFSNFKDLIESSDKKFSNLLCSQCKKDKDVNFRCNDNNLFFCTDCKNNYNSNNFSEIDEIDIVCSVHHRKYKYYDITKNKNICELCFDEEKENYEKNANFIEIEKYINYKNIDNVYKKTIENIKMWNNTCKLIKDWLKKLNDSYNEFINSITNYCLLQQKIVIYIKNKNSYDKIKNNFNLYCNYEAINDPKTDKFIRETNEIINVKYNKHSDICNMSNFFITILENFNSQEISIEAKCNVIIPKKNNEDNKNQDKKNIKEIKLIKDMNKKKFELDSEIRCFLPFDKENYLILGMSTGEIIICEKKEDDIKEKLRIKEFQSEINHICEIDKHLIIASDKNNKAKIIEINDELKQYIIIKDIDFSHYNKIYKIIPLPIFSYFKNRQYFVVSVDNYIKIYSSNKMPKYLDPPYIQYHEHIQEFSIAQPSFSQNKDEKLDFEKERTIKLKNPAENMLEVNDQYLAIAFPNTKNLKFLNMQKDFKDEINYKDIISPSGSFMKVTKTKTELVINNKNNINIIDFNNLKKIRNIKLKHNIDLFDFFESNNIICFSADNDNICAKQYIFKNGFREMNKLSEFMVLNEKKITNLIIIKDKIYYTDYTNVIHYYE